MKNIKEIRTDVCAMMHKLMAQGITTKSEAMFLAWRNVKLAEQLKQGVVEFTFVKIDGSIRHAVGTLRTDLIPETKRTAERKNAGYNEKCLTYFDIEKADWRCSKRINLCY
jgi:hypothetical protein